MKNQISLLMDGELCDEDAEALLVTLRGNADAGKEWSTYHLIGDVLRQPDYISRDFAGKLAQRLREEPTVLAPPVKSPSRLAYFAMSAVASVMAMAFLAWMAMHIDDGQSARKPIQFAQQPATQQFSGAVAANEAVNDYLLAHHEYSPNTDVRGASSYLRTVSVKQIVAGQ